MLVLAIDLKLSWTWGIGALVPFPKCGKKGILVHYWWNSKVVEPLWKKLWIPQEIKTITNIWSTNSSSGNISKVKQQQQQQQPIWSMNEHKWWCQAASLLFFPRGPPPTSAQVHNLFPGRAHQEAASEALGQFKGASHSRCQPLFAFRVGWAPKKSTLVAGHMHQDPGQTVSLVISWTGWWF